MYFFSFSFFVFFSVLAVILPRLEAARVIFHITQGVRISWANGLMTANACRDAIGTGVDMLFEGLAA